MDLGTHLYFRLPASKKHYILYEFDEITSILLFYLDKVHKAERHHKNSRFMAVTTTWKNTLQSQH